MVTTPSVQFEPLVLRGVRFDPPLFCAPMAELTHSAFRRLLADFGGYGALCTEMLSAKMTLQEKPDVSPGLKRRPQEGKVVYQLLVTDTERLPEIIDRLSALRPDGLDLNCACGAANIRRRGGGVALFDDARRLGQVARELRRGFAGPLTAKIRLGCRTDDWWDRLVERVGVLEGEGADAVFLHPRFTEDKFKRLPRHELYAELAGRTRLPLIANGDISGPDYVSERAAQFAPVAGLMVGRQAAAQPWIFARWRDRELAGAPHTPPAAAPDLAELVRRYCGYLADDFALERAVRRLKIWMHYFARNFVFGHTLATAVQGAPDWAGAVARALAFLDAKPERLEPVSLAGL